MKTINVFDTKVPSGIRYQEFLQEAKQEYYTNDPISSCAYRTANLDSTRKSIHRANMKMGGTLIRLTIPNWVEVI